MWLHFFQRCSYACLHKYLLVWRPSNTDTHTQAHSLIQLTCTNINTQLAYTFYVYSLSRRPSQIYPQALLLTQALTHLQALLLTQALTHLQARLLTQALTHLHARLLTQALTHLQALLLKHTHTTCVQFWCPHDVHSHAHVRTHDCITWMCWLLMRPAQGSCHLYFVYVCTVYVYVYILYIYIVCALMFSHLTSGLILLIGDGQIADCTVRHRGV